MPLADLIAITYSAINRTVMGLDSAMRLMREKVPELDGAVYVTKDAKGALDLYHMIILLRANAAAGGACGALWSGRIGLRFLQPLTRAVTGRAIAAGTGDA